jgi:hypothetical protein
MLNTIWLGLILAAVAIAGITGRVKEMTDGAIDSSKTAVTLAIGLIGIMALWLGVMRLAEKSGLVQVIASAIRPVMKWLFPDVPAHHPAMGSMLMNIAANMLGLANAATPLGLRAMKDLERLNPASRHRDQRDVHLSSQSTPARAAHPCDRSRRARLRRLRQSHGDHRHRFPRDALLQRRRHHERPASGKAAHLSRARAHSGRGDRGRSRRPQRAGAIGPTPPIAPWGYAALALLFLVFAAMFVSQIVPEWFGRPPSTETGNLLIRSVGAISLLAIPVRARLFPHLRRLTRTAGV